MNLESMIAKYEVAEAVARLFAEGKLRPENATEGKHVDLRSLKSALLAEMIDAKRKDGTDCKVSLLISMVAWNGESTVELKNPRTDKRVCRAVEAAIKILRKSPMCADVVWDAPKSVREGKDYSVEEVTW